MIMGFHGTLLHLFQINNTMTSSLVLKLKIHFHSQNMFFRLPKNVKFEFLSFHAEMKITGTPKSFSKKITTSYLRLLDISIEKLMHSRLLIRSHNISRLFYVMNMPR